MPSFGGAQSNPVPPLDLACAMGRRQADGAPLGQARLMSTPESASPQPRDIALEQETPEQAEDLEAQSDPESGAEES
jgi:hypothetical protein